MYEKEYTKALEAAQKAAMAIQHVASQPFDVQHKSADQPVTLADRQSNELIQQILLGAFTEDGWLSEETQDNPNRLSKKRVWIVDPLDGTKEFIGQIPEYAISIALAVDGSPVVGVIHNPATGEVFSCRKGAGAFLNGAPIHTSTQSNLKQARILASRSECKRGEWESHKDHFIVVPSGGMAHKMSEVASGRADASFSLTPKNEWDFAAGLLLIQEAGGAVAFPNGTPINLNKPSPLAPGILYSNGPLFQTLLDYL